MIDEKSDNSGHFSPPEGREARRELAVELLATAELSLSAIADRVGVGRSTLYEWLKDEDFAGRVEARRDQIRAEIRRYGVAVRETRVRALNDRWNRLRRVIEARADDPEHQAAPGGSTGLLVRQTKKIGQGRDAETVVEFSVDTGLLAEIRAHEQQAAKELGQWTDKQEIQHSGGLALTGDLSKLSTERLLALRDIADELAESRPGGGPSGG